MQRMTKQFLAFLLSFLVALPASAIDVNGQLKNAQLEKQSSDPTSYEARIYYNTAEKKAKIYNGTAWQNVGSGSGTAGNLVTNGDSEDAAVPSGWGTYDDGASAAAVDGTGGSPSASTAIARTTTAGELISGAGTWKLAKSAADAQGEGWSYAFTIPANSTLKNALNEVSFNYYMSAAPASDLFRVYVYDVTNAALITPSFTTCGGGTTPSLTSTTTPCAARLSWVATTGTSYRLLIHVASTNATAVNLFVDDLFVGQRGVQVGSAQSECRSVTFTGTWNTNTTYTAKECRTGDLATYDVAVALSGAPNSATLTLTLPTGRTIDTTKLATTTAQRTSLGEATILDSGTAQFHGEVLYASSTTVAPVYADDTAPAVQLLSITQAAPQTWAVNDGLFLRFTVPIAEWAGGVAYGDNPGCEYAYNSGTWDADDDTSFAYGPAGQTITASTNLTTGRTKKVRFQSIIQSTDEPPRLQFEVAGRWVDAPAYLRDSGYTIEPLHYGASAAATNEVGASVQAIASTDTDVYVRFGHYAHRYNNATDVGWSTAIGSSVIKWRVKKCRAGQAVGFGLASATDYGLVKGGSVPGNTTGAATAAGYVGEVVTAAPAANSTTTFNSRIDFTASLSLTAGLWLVTCSGTGYMNGAPTAGTCTAPSIVLRNSTDSADVMASSYGGLYCNAVAGTDSQYFSWNVTTTVNISGSKSYKVQGYSLGASGSPATGGLGSRADGSGCVAVRL